VSPNRSLWEQFARELLRLGAPAFDGRSQRAAFAGITSYADLANADPAVSNATWYLFGNTIPQWSGAYAPCSDLIGAYTLFLSCVSPGAAAAPPNATALRAAFHASLAAHAARPSGTTRAAASAAQRHFTASMQAAYGPAFEPVAEALRRVGAKGGARDVLLQTPYNMAVKTGAVAPAGALPWRNALPRASAQASGFAPAYSLNGFIPVYQEWQTKSVSGAVDVGPIRVCGNDGCSVATTIGWEPAAVREPAPAFLDAPCTVRRFCAKLWLTGLGSFTIAPGTWFQQSLVGAYRGRLTPGAPAFFGPDGVLALLPSALLVGFEPKLVLGLDEDDYAAFKRAAGATMNLRVRFGGVQFAADGERAAAPVRPAFDDRNGTVTFGPVKSAVPLVLAVIASVL
jgi:hypothetical protein